MRWEGRECGIYCFFQALLLVQRRWVDINATKLGQNIQHNMNIKLQLKFC